MEKLGQRLFKLRKSRKLTQTQIADLFCLTQASINKYEHGSATPSIETLRRYADYFDVSMDYIFARTDNPQGKPNESNNYALPHNVLSLMLLEICFAPESAFNTKLKQTILQVVEESKNESNSK